MKKYFVLAFTENAKKLYKKFDEAFKTEANIKLISTEEIGLFWDEADAFIFICATGIAVRHIAPYLKDKLEDPAVIVMDELGSNVVPILSGHVGGANELSRMIEEKLGAKAIITTATDINGVLAIDEWANNNGLIIKNKSGIKKVSMKLLKSEDINISFGSDVFVSKDEPEESNLWLSYQREVVVGLGCKKDTPFEKIKDFFCESLADSNVELSEVIALSSIDLKMEEDGLLELSNHFDIPIYFYTSEELKNVPGEFDQSDFVEKITGVSDVSARAAKCYGRVGKFLLKKKKQDGMTISIFEKAKVIKISYEED